MEQELVNQSLMLTSVLSTVGKILINFIIGSSAQQTGFGKTAQNTIGRFITRPMTRDEACKILNIEESKELNNVEILEVCYFSIFNDMIAL